MKTFTLNNGAEIPQVGFGTYSIPEEDCISCVRDALSVGYRLIDTAQTYGNEHLIGKAIKTSEVPRSDVFIISKVWISNYGYDRTMSSIEESLRSLGTDYIDLMLLHEPYCDRYGAYRALEDACKAGKLRSIGVSNFYPDHYVDLVYNFDIVPAANEIEMHPFTQREQDFKYADEFGTRLISWSPFASGERDIFHNPVLCEVASRHGKSVGQVILRWLNQRGAVIIPKSVRRSRMEENFDIFGFSLTDEDMKEISTLETGEYINGDHHDPEEVRSYILDED